MIDHPASLNSFKKDCLLMNLVLVRSCCGQPDIEHTGVVCPDGLIECVECLQRVEWTQLSKDADGTIVNVCLTCDICVPLAHVG